MKSRVIILAVGLMIGVALGASGIIALGPLAGKAAHSPSACEAAPSSPTLVRESALSNSPHETAPSSPAFVPDVTRPEQLGVWTLAGVEAVYLKVHVWAVESNNPLSEARLQTQVEIALRKAGIKVVDKPTAKKTPNAGQLFAFVRLRMMDIDGAQIYATTVQVTFSQAVRLFRNANVLTFTRTWPYTSLADTPMILGSAKVEEGVRECLDAQVNDFINDFLTANPRSPQVGGNRG